MSSDTQMDGGDTVIVSLGKTPATSKRIDEDTAIHVCWDCNARFTRLEHLKRHITSLHITSPKSHGCEYCGKSFSRRYRIPIVTDVPHILTNDAEMFFSATTNLVVQRRKAKPIKQIKPEDIRAPTGLKGTNCKRPKVIKTSAPLATIAYIDSPLTGNYSPRRNLVRTGTPYTFHQSLIVEQRLYLHLVTRLTCFCFRLQPARPNFDRHQILSPQSRLVTIRDSNLRRK